MQHFGTFSVRKANYLSTEKNSHQYKIKYEKVFHGTVIFENTFQTLNTELGAKTNLIRVENKKQT